MKPELAEIIEACLLTAGHPLTVKQLQALFAPDETPGRDDIKAVLAGLAEQWQGRCLELVEVGSGYRLQARSEFRPWLARLDEERPARYSRATLETLAIIVYRQPVTRGAIEEVRGVSVSSQIIRTLVERDWIRIVGHRDVPGKPALYGTTKQFLDDFNLRSLDELPPLSEIMPADHLQKELDLQAALEAAAVSEGAATDGENGQPDEAAVAGAVESTAERVPESEAVEG